jgi:hypothetical protein
MTWSPQSPDLNPSEMGWDELDCKVKEKQQTSAQHMWELLQECWKSIPGELVERTTQFHVLFHSFDVFTIIL